MAPTSPLPAPARAKCTVPNIEGRTLAAARKVLNAVHCSVGKVITPKQKPARSPGNHNKWVQVISRESPGPGSVRRAATKVALMLVWKPVRISA